MKTFHKLFQTKASSIDEDSRSVTFVISTNDEDRYGDVVEQKSWDFKSYLSNPIVLWGHDPDQPENVLGTAKDLQIAPDGSKTTATLTFDADINPKAGLVFEQIKRGTLRTVSVGFRNHSLEWDNDTPILKDNELFEISVVPIPANAGAVALAFKDGSLNQKDATWMLDSMRKESELLEKELAHKLNDKRKTMTDEQAQALTDSVAKLTEQVQTQNERLDAQAASLDSLKFTGKPTKTEEEKTTREAAEAKEVEEAEARRKAEEEAKNDPAKGGDNDQPGAGEDDFDPDAEVTPEQQAEIDAAIEAAELEPANA